MLIPLVSAIQRLAPAPVTRILLPSQQVVFIVIFAVVIVVVVVVVIWWIGGSVQVGVLKGGGRGGRRGEKRHDCGECGFVHHLVPLGEVRGVQVCYWYVHSTP